MSTTTAATLTLSMVKNIATLADLSDRHAKVLYVVDGVERSGIARGITTFDGQTYTRQADVRDQFLHITLGTCEVFMPMRQAIALVDARELVEVRPKVPVTV